MLSVPLDITVRLVLVLLSLVLKEHTTLILLKDLLLTVWLVPLLNTVKAME